MPTEREIICLGCPNGCHLTVTIDGTTITVAGAKCDRGEDYAREEILEPKRTVTAVVRTNSARVPYVSVKTDRPFPRPLIPVLLQELYRLQIALPVRAGDVLIANSHDTGINVVYTRSATD